MSVPSVPITIPDGQLGIRAPSSAVLAILATATDGEIGVPKTATRKEDLVDEFVSGPLVEQGAYAIERYGLTILSTRVEAETDGSHGAIDTSGVEGTSVVTLDGAVDPVDDFEVYVEFTTGGTIGVAGIKYRESYDNGRTFSPVKALGTAATLTVAGAAKFNFAAGTIEPGDVVKVQAFAPAWGADSLAVGLDAIRVTQAPWTRLGIYGDCNSAAISLIDAKLEQMASKGRNRRAIGHARAAASGEDASDYLAALQAELGGSACRRLLLTAGRCKTDSSVARRRYRRPPSLAVAARSASLSEEIDMAEINLGPLPGVFIRDEHGNPDEHDETVNPGLDEARFCTLRTWESRTGTFVNNPRLFSPVGSDFIWLQYGLVVDLVCSLVRPALEPILNKGVFVVPDGSGQIDPEVATSIEGLVNGILSRHVVGARKATRCLFVLDRKHDVLRTGRQPWKVRTVPLAYIKEMPGEVALVAEESSPANPIL